MALTIGRSLLIPILHALSESIRWNATTAFLFSLNRGADIDELIQGDCGNGPTHILHVLR